MAPSLIDRPVYSMPILSANQTTPAASTNYYIGHTSLGPTTSATLPRQYIPLSSTIKLVQLMIFCLVPGSAEMGSVYVRINDTTDYLVSDTVQWNAALNIVFNDARNNPVMTEELTPTDYWIIKIVTPAWVTPPTNIQYWGTVGIAGDV